MPTFELYGQEITTNGTVLTTTHTSMLINFPIRSVLNHGLSGVEFIISFIIHLKYHENLNYLNPFFCIAAQMARY